MTLTYEQAKELKPGDVLYWYRIQMGGMRWMSIRVSSVYVYKRKPACKVHAFNAEWTINQGHEHPKLSITAPEGVTVDDMFTRVNPFNSQSLSDRLPRNTAPKEG